MSSLTNLLSSPAVSDASTILGNGKTLPDISLGSLGSSFRSDDDEGRKTGRTPVSKASRLPAMHSPDASSMNAQTPSPHAPSSALLNLSPPSTVHRASSYPALLADPPGSQAPRRSRILRRGSISSVSSDGETLEARYTETTEDDGILSSLSLNVSPRLGASQKQRPGQTKRSGRQSVAGDVSVNGPLTLRDQEQQLNAAKKDIFNLQLENHFLKERLANMAPDHIEAALKENVKIKLEILNLSKEMKKLKKLLTQQDKDLAEAQREREGGRGSKERASDLRELEDMYAQEKARRQEATEVVQEWKARAGDLEAELDLARGKLDDQEEEMDRLRDAADRAEERADELAEERAADRAAGHAENEDNELRDQLAAAQLDVQRREQEIEQLNEELENKVQRENELRDQLAAAQLDVERRDQEIEQLNEELDNKVRDHENDVKQVEAEWRDEVQEARAQVDELKDALEQRGEELVIANEKVAELEAVQAETHDRLEETLKNIERDNADKDADLVAANREVEELGQRVYDLEEACEELRARERDLATDLQSADEAFEQSKIQYESLVAALKTARQQLENERDHAVADARAADDERASVLRDREYELGKLRRALEERELVNGRLQGELDAARDRATLRDRDLTAVQANLRSLESERDKLGSSQANKQGLELEIERLRREIVASEQELDRARDEVEHAEERLRQRDVEVASLLDKQRDLENRLASERQGRLNVSDKLDMANKHARQHEQEATTLRERLEDLEPLLTQTQQQQLQTQRRSDAERQERSELLIRVLNELNRFLGSEDSATPANFAVFKDTLLSRLRSVGGAKNDFEKRIKAVESSMDQQVGSLKRQLESKWRAVDQFEASIRKLDATRLQWKARYAEKEGELEAAKANNADLARQLSSLKTTARVSPDPAQSRSLNERANSAERRANNASQQLAQLEQRIAELQSRSAQAEDKWAARVKEYENRLRIAGEKIKTEKQGGKERARQLEEQVRELEKQVEAARKRGARVDGIVASAAHLLPSS